MNRTHLARRKYLLGALGPWLLVGGLSCAPTKVVFDIHAGRCLNPPDGRCNGSGSDSKIMQLRMYQLKKPVDPCKLTYEDFVQGVEQDALKGVLADAQQPPLVQNVDRLEWRTIPPWDLVEGAQYLLVVNVGRGHGSRSMRLIDLNKRFPGWRKVTFPLFLDVYDICRGAGCSHDRDTTEQCK